MFLATGLSCVQSGKPAIGTDMVYSTNEIKYKLICETSTIYHPPAGGLQPLGKYQPEVKPAKPQTRLALGQA